MRSRLLSFTHVQCIVSSFRRGNSTQGIDERYLKEVVIGYCVPFVYVLLTAIVEFSAAQCSPWRPRFLEGQCWYSG